MIQESAQTHVRMEHLASITNANNAHQTAGHAKVNCHTAHLASTASNSMKQNAFKSALVVQRLLKVNVKTAAAVALSVHHRQTGASRVLKTNF